MQSLQFDDYINYIRKQTKKRNIDNITRTNSYQNFYDHYPEIKWSFLASMVSRNAGWNMTDLYTDEFTTLLSDRTRKQLLSTYERANWLIFSDAYPQLLLYKLSTIVGYPLFHLLDAFHVSVFMKKEWFHFWYYNDKERLMKALIINEQNVIQKPVSEHPFYQKHIFKRWPYLIQDALTMNAVLFPAQNGNVYGLYVRNFVDVTERIHLGKKLSKILFHTDTHPAIYKFAKKTEHTGSRKDYAKNSKVLHNSSRFLRLHIPVIQHQDTIRNDWFLHGGVRKKWWAEPEIDINTEVSHHFYIKRKVVRALTFIKKGVTISKKG
ncbi:DUF2515 domain-containing protein [Aquibacillus sp. 3ASR75-11]|uniref:DUF2515 domain-containing protein n=1 Tax=Terrihalobacillus insolitus TaxID=2950438 RepID=A0A9X3WRY8_9BACI|nr:DUF2515 family protein [Terrihalobacillus insolitus]MDC3424757.1 DUF2515 domain-containing protein [Terrihalobacillus insolitus]